MSKRAPWRQQQVDYEKRALKVGYKKGDFVKVTRKQEFMVNGWASHWSDVFMSPLIGRTGKIVAFSGCAGYEVQFKGENRTWNFPYEVLHLVNNKIIGAIDYEITESRD